MSTSKSDQVAVYWERLLLSSPGPTRADLITLFEGCPEFRTVCGEHLMRNDPTAAELERLVSSLEDTSFRTRAAALLLKKNPTLAQLARIALKIPKKRVAAWRMLRKRRGVRAALVGMLRWGPDEGFRDQIWREYCRRRPATSQLVEELSRDQLCGDSQWLRLQIGTLLLTRRLGAEPLRKIMEWVPTLRAAAGRRLLALGGEDNLVRVVRFGDSSVPEDVRHDAARRLIAIGTEQALGTVILDVPSAAQEAWELALRLPPSEALLREIVRLAKRVGADIAAHAGRLLLSQACSAETITTVAADVPALRDEAARMLAERPPESTADVMKEIDLKFGP